MKKTDKTKEAFYKAVFQKNRELVDNAQLKFKFEMDVFMLVLSAKYKPKTFENESETRIVFFNYNIPQPRREKFATVNYDFGSFMKPFVECRFLEKDKKELSEEVKGMILSPAVKRIPVPIEMYKQVICDFLEKDRDFDIRISEHDIRW